MSADLERLSLKSGGNSVGSAGRSLSINVKKLHNALNVLLNDLEREQFIHCLNVYHAKRNVFDLVQTLKVILNTPSKRQLLPMLRLVIPRSDQLLFDQYTSEGLYLRPDLLATGGSQESSDEISNTRVTTVHFPNQQEQPSSCHASLLTTQDGFSTAGEGTAPLAPNLGGMLMQEGPEDIRQVTLTRSKSQEGLGFSIRGGSEHGVGIYVSLVEPGSFAEREGLRIGDQIVKVNDVVFDRVSHGDAVKVLKGCKKLCMSVCSMGRIPGGYVTNHVYTWVDPQGRSVSPPPDLEDHHNTGGRHSESQRRSHSFEGMEKKVNLSLDDGLSLGLMIRGGAEYALGIYITGVDHGSAAEYSGLKVGDQILEVNGQSFLSVPHDEAVQILKNSRHLLLTVRDVGRLPHARTVVDETKWIPSPHLPESSACSNSAPCGMGPSMDGINMSSAKPSFGRGAPGLVLGQPRTSLDEQVGLLLTEQETQTLAYYLQEYQERHIGVQQLVMALFELLNTHAKFSLLTEVRALVSAQDLERFDGLVLHREMEAWRARHGPAGPLHPDSICVAHSEGQATAQSSPNSPCYTQKECRLDCHHLSATQGTLNALPDVALDEMSCTEAPPPFKPPPPPGPSASLVRHSSPQTQAKRPSSKLSQTGLMYNTPCRIHQDSHSQKHTPCHAHATGSTHHKCPTHAVGHTHAQSSTHNSPCTIHHTSPGHHTPPHYSVHHSSPHYSVQPASSPCLHLQPHPALAKDLVQFLLSRQAAAPSAPTSQHAERPGGSRSASPRSSATPSPSLLVPAPPPCSPEGPDGTAHGSYRLNPESESREERTPPQPRGATLSQLSDSGQTLSEDSGVDIPEAVGQSKDGSPRPGKPPCQRAVGDPRGGDGPPPGPLRQMGLAEPTLVRVLKSASTLGIAVEGGANTRQPLPRIVTIQMGGSAHNSGQLRVGQVILEVNGVSLRGLEHREAARLIAEAFKTKDSDHIDFLVTEFNASL